MAVRGDPMWLISVPIESAHATSSTSYWSSIVTLVLFCPVSEIFQVFCMKTATPHPLFHPNFGGVSLGLDRRCWGSEERRP